MQQLFPVLERELRFRQQVMFHAVLQQIERAQPFLAKSSYASSSAISALYSGFRFVGKVAGYVRTYQQTFRISVHHEIRKLLQVGQQSIFLVLHCRACTKNSFKASSNRRTSTARHHSLSESVPHSRATDRPARQQAKQSAASPSAPIPSASLRQVRR